MKKILVLLCLLLSSQAFAQCENIFSERFADLTLRRVSSAKSQFLDAAGKVQKAYVVKNDLVIASSAISDRTCVYYFTKKGTYTAGYLKSNTLERNTSSQKVAGFWANDSGDNKISVQQNSSFKADLGFRGGNSLSFGELSGRFIRSGVGWRYKRGECEVNVLVVNNVLIAAGGDFCGFAINIKMEGIYVRK